jgi:hypothetical protein
LHACKISFLFWFKSSDFSGGKNNWWGWTKIDFEPFP